ncbi:unnamed protein product [Boreogadus saida]
MTRARMRHKKQTEKRICPCSKQTAPELTPVPEPCPVPEPYSFPRVPLFQIFQTFQKGPALYLAFQRGAAF